MTYSIQLDYKGGVSDSQKRIFDASAARWSKIIVCDQKENSSNNLVIEIEGLDCSLGDDVIGEAYPTHLRKISRLPSQGIIKLSKDLIGRLNTYQALEGVIMHEIGHILGFGSLWLTNKLVKDINTNKPLFIGEKALLEYRKLKNDDSKVGVPIENSGGKGTRIVHWDEAVFENELMTGWPRANQSFPLSRLTIASLEDLGYIVDYNHADFYQLSLLSQYYKGVIFEEMRDLELKVSRVKIK